MRHRLGAGLEGGNFPTKTDDSWHGCMIRDLEYVVRESSGLSPAQADHSRPEPVCPVEKLPVLCHEWRILREKREFQYRTGLFLARIGRS